VRTADSASAATDGILWDTGDVGGKAGLGRAKHHLPRPPACAYKNTACNGENGILLEIAVERLYIKVRGRL
jgi:hypothetical protein